MKYKRMGIDKQIKKDDTFGFSYRCYKWWCDHDDNKTHSIRTASAPN